MNDVDSSQRDEDLRLKENYGYPPLDQQSPTHCTCCHIYLDLYYTREHVSLSHRQLGKIFDWHVIDDF